MNFIYWILSWFGYSEYARLGGRSRSPLWSKTRNVFIKEHPICEVCGRHGTLLRPNEVHHCLPFYLHPELELESTNLITLCREHHLLFGHYMNWKSYNINVRSDAELWLLKIINRPK